MPLLLYLSVMIPFRICFANEPEVFSGVYWFEISIEMVKHTPYTLRPRGVNFRVDLTFLCPHQKRLTFCIRVLDFLDGHRVELSHGLPSGGDR